MRKVPFIAGEFYHIYNRGVDKRDVFSDQDDINRFFQSMKEFNVIEPIGSIYENKFQKSKNKPRSSTPKSNKLVEFVVYCLNPNHYHFLLTPVNDKGVEKFMQKLGTGYTNYFNEKYKRSGSLFQGRFKAVHIDTNEYLLHLSTYVNLNDRVHQLGSSTPKLGKSSWGEYMKEVGDSVGVESSGHQGFCNKDIILGQFDSVRKYKKFAEESLEGILERRKEDKNLDELLLE